MVQLWRCLDGGRRRPHADLTGVMDGGVKAGTHTRSPRCPAKRDSKGIARPCASCEYSQDLP